jgi:hypothetical protein
MRLLHTVCFQGALLVVIALPGLDPGIDRATQ